MFSLLHSCTLCPRNCGTDRYKGGLGYCKSNAEFTIASICIHQGEEPAISGQQGICNIFFPHCNLQCIYCQNYQISRNTATHGMRVYALNEIVKTVTEFLDKGCQSVGFVTPTHYTPHVHAIIDALYENNRHPVTVYNTNGYDKVEMLQTLENKVDVYLPDFKYINPEIAESYSGAKDYPEVVKRSLKEMYRQKGNSVMINEAGIAVNGMIIRHLVLPGQVKDSKKILRWIAEELSPSVYISLMAQYNPPNGITCPGELQRKLLKEEYDSVVEEMEFLGFSNGWIQELGSSQEYNPDFLLDHPF